MMPPSSQSHQQHGASVVGGPYSYTGGMASDAPQHAAYTTSPISPTSPVGSTTRATSQFPGLGGASSSASHEFGRGRTGQQLETLAQDYNHLDAGWSPEPSVNTGRRSSRSGSHVGQQPRAEYNQTSPTQSTFISGRPRRSSSQLYDPNSSPAPPLDDTRMSVDTSSGSQKLCIIPRCQYTAYYNVAEGELMEYCGHGHELQAIETGFVKPCVMCKGRPRRTGERVCGPVCRERERLAVPVHGNYYGVPVTRREPQTRPR